MGTSLPEYYRDESGLIYKLICLATYLPFAGAPDPVYILECTTTGMNTAVPFSDMGKTFHVEWDHEEEEESDTSKCTFCREHAVIELDGDQLCRWHANRWLKGEGNAAAEYNNDR